MSKKKNDGAIEMGSREPREFVNPGWALNWARKLGLELRRQRDRYVIVAPGGEILEPAKLSRADCDSIETLAKAGRAAEVTREADPEHMTPAEQKRAVAMIQAATDNVKAKLRIVSASIYAPPGVAIQPVSSDILELERAVQTLKSLAGVA